MDGKEPVCLFVGNPLRCDQRLRRGAHMGRRVRWSVDRCRQLGSVRRSRLDRRPRVCAAGHAVGAHRRRHVDMQGRRLPLRERHDVLRLHEQQRRHLHGQRLQLLPCRRGRVGFCHQPVHVHDGGEQGGSLREDRQGEPCDFIARRERHGGLLDVRRRQQPCGGGSPRRGDGACLGGLLPTVEHFPQRLQRRHSALHEELPSPDESAAARRERRRAGLRQRNAVREFHNRRRRRHQPCGHHNVSQRREVYLLRQVLPRVGEQCDDIVQQPTLRHERRELGVRDRNVQHAGRVGDIGSRRGGQCRALRRRGDQLLDRLCRRKDGKSMPDA